MATALRIVFSLLTCVTVGMIIGAFVQLAFIRQLEDSYGSGSSFGRRLGNQHESNPSLMRGIFLWEHDREANILRLGYVKPEILSWSPRIILFRNFLSIEINIAFFQCMVPLTISSCLSETMFADYVRRSLECNYLMEVALPRLHTSMVEDEDSRKAIESDERTSYGMFLLPDERKHPIVQAIEKRISVYSQVPVERGENMQILRYQKNQYYRPHHDYYENTDFFNVKRGGQRIATMLMYLSDNVEGGETYFPMAGSGECSCGGKLVKGLCVKPAKGDAVLFWTVGFDGEVDPKSIHGGCEVLSGEKWSATKWMWHRNM